MESPIAADRPENAARGAELDLGRVVGPAARTAAAIRGAAREVLAEPRFRRNAERMRAEMASLPGPEHGVELLEDGVAAHRPLAATA